MTVTAAHGQEETRRSSRSPVCAGTSLGDVGPGGAASASADFPAADGLPRAHLYRRRIRNYYVLRMCTVRTGCHGAPSRLTRFARVLRGALHTLCTLCGLVKLSSSSWALTARPMHSGIAHFSWPVEHTAGKIVQDILRLESGGREKEETSEGVREQGRERASERASEQARVRGRERGWESGSH